MFLCFSLYTNAKKLLSTDQAPGSLTAVHGIRFLSMSWVVMGHTYGMFLSIGSKYPLIEMHWPINLLIIPWFVYNKNFIKLNVQKFVFYGNTHKTHPFSENPWEIYPKLIDRWTFTAIDNALVSVDTFFTMRYEWV